MLLQQRLLSAVLSMLLTPVVSVRLSGVSTNQQMQMLLRLLPMVQMLPQQLLLSAVLPVLLTAVAVRTAVQMLLLVLLSMVSLQMLLKAVLSMLLLKRVLMVVQSLSVRLQGVSTNM